MSGHGPLLDLGYTDPPPPVDLAARARGRARRLRRTRRAAVASGVAAILCAGAVAVALPSPAPPAPASPTLSPGWTRIAPSPLSPRHQANVVALGDEVLVVGGDEHPCNDTGAVAAACVMPAVLPDAAVYDVKGDRWRKVASPPVPVRRWSTAVAGGDVLAVVSSGTDHHLLAYSMDDDRWTRPPAPPQLSGVRLVAVGGGVVAYRTHTGRRPEPDLLRDPATGRWRPLPADPLGALIERALLPVGPDRLVLAGMPAGNTFGRQRPALYRAAVLDLSTRTWRVMPPSEVAFSESTWLAVGEGTATRVVNPTSGRSGAYAGTGRLYATGGILDPYREVWSALPARPRRQPTPVRIGTLAGEGLVVTDGLALDVAAGTWRSLSAPEPLRDLTGVAAVWAGDRAFFWGGTRRGDRLGASDLFATGWTWRP